MTPRANEQVGEDARFCIFIFALQHCTSIWQAHEQITGGEPMSRQARSKLLDEGGSPTKQVWISDYHDQLHERKASKNATMQVTTQALN